MGILFFQAICTTILLYMMILNLSNYSFDSWQIIFAVNASMLITIIVSYVSENKDMSANICYICLPAVFLFLKTKKIISSIIYSALSLIIMIASSQISIFFICKILRTNSDKIRVDTYQNCLYFVMLAILAYFISKLIGVITRRIEDLLIGIETKYKALVLLGFVSVLMLFNYQIFINPNVSLTEYSIISSIISILFLIFLIAGVFSFINGIKISIETAHKQDSLKQLQEYTVNLENMYGEMRKFRHDYINILATLYGYIEYKDLEGLEKYFNTSIAPIGEKMRDTNSTLDRLKKINILELKGLLALKLMQAQDQGIHVQIEVVESIEAIDFYIIDLTRIIGILVDNAVEACEEIKDSVLKVAIVKEANIINILIVNSIQEPFPSIEKIYKEGFSTKGEGRGLGLHTVRRIIDQSNNVILNTYISDNDFIQELKILNKED